MDPDVMRSNHFQMRLCIDLANGHMNKLLKVIKYIKKSYGDLVIIMSGNIANPNTYTEYELVGCDYVRVSIGTGSGCLTASNTGVYYPPFSLLKEMSEIRKQYHGNCKIIADGGIKGFRDIQKALIYADYVMIGGLFNKCIESSGLTTYGKSYFKVGQYKLRNYIVDLFRYGKKIDPSKYDKVIPLVKSGMLEVNKQFYGMSTKLAQKETKTNKSLKTSEGLVKTNKVEYTLEQWIENEMSYLKSAMSYTNSVDLVDYKESQWVRINQIAYNK
jgi:tRNA-dihydrouridine synthase